MSEYKTSVRTNYFHVKDEETFLDFMSRVIVDGGDIELLMNTDAEGLPTFGFATRGLIIGIRSDDDETQDDDAGFDDEYGDFLAGLQEIVEDGDAIIILEIGESGPGNISAISTIITSDDTDYLDLQELSSDKAVDMLMRQRDFYGLRR